MRTLCKHCNNSNKITNYLGKDEFVCLGASKDRIKEFEKDARELKKATIQRRRYFNS